MDFWGRGVIILSPTQGIDQPGENGTACGADPGGQVDLGLSSRETRACKEAIFGVPIIWAHGWAGRVTTRESGEEVLGLWAEIQTGLQGLQESSGRGPKRTNSRSHGRLTALLQVSFDRGQRIGSVLGFPPSLPSSRETTSLDLIVTSQDEPAGEV